MNEEVKEEIEALLSIYEEDMEVLSESPNYVISMNVRSMNEIEDCPSLKMQFTYPDGYPDNVLSIEYDDEEASETFEDEELQELTLVLDQVMEENKGSVMTFLAISAAIEWLEQHHVRSKELKEKREREKKELEDKALTKKLEGTKVTVESFMAWKLEFDEKRLKGKAKKAVQNKLTGKELFLTNSKLNESDLQFISSEENVEFDEALFEDMDGLEIDDEEE